MITQLENMQIAMDVVDFLSKHDRWHDCTIMVGNVTVGSNCPRNTDDYDTIALNDQHKAFISASCENMWEGSLTTPMIIRSCDSLYHLEDFDSTIEKYGVKDAFWESADSNTLFVYIPDEYLCQFETCALIVPEPKEERVRIHFGDDVPSELQNIMDYWYEQSRQNGDKGSCVFGAGIGFTYAGCRYFMCACSPWQGALSWEIGINNVEQMLRDIGATDVTYDPGRSD